MYAYDTTTQTITTPNVFQAITFSNNQIINGWTHTAGTSQFNCHQAGLYLIEYDTTPNQSGTTIPVTMSLRAATGGGEIAGSQRGFTVDVINSPRALTVSFLAQFGNGDTLQFQLAGGAAGIQIVPIGTGVITPSISTTITRIT